MVHENELSKVYFSQAKSAISATFGQYPGSGARGSEYEIVADDELLLSLELILFDLNLATN